MAAENDSSLTISFSPHLFTVDVKFENHIVFGRRGIFFSNKDPGDGSTCFETQFKITKLKTLFERPCIYFLSKIVLVLVKRRLGKIIRL